MVLIISVIYNSLYWDNVSLMIYNTALDSLELLGLALSAIIVSFLLPSIEYLLKVWVLNSTIFQENLYDASNSLPERKYLTHGPDSSCFYILQGFSYLCLIHDSWMQLIPAFAGAL